MGRCKHFQKKNVEFHEYALHLFVYNLNIIPVPRIIRYNQQTKILTLDDVGNDNVSNNYGETANCVPEYIFDKIRYNILQLYQNGILYPDITGYNFIEHKNNGKVYTLDFEHASYMSNDDNTFVEQFLDGLNEWNPEFK